MLSRPLLIALLFLPEIHSASAQTPHHEFAFTTGLGGFSHQDGFIGAFDGTLPLGGTEPTFAGFPWSLEGFLVLGPDFEIGSSLSNYNFSGTLNPYTPDSDVAWNTTTANFFSAIICGKYFPIDGWIKPYLLVDAGATFYTVSTPPTGSEKLPIVAGNGRITQYQSILPLIGAGVGLDLYFLHFSDCGEIGVFAQGRYDLVLFSRGNISFAPLECGLSLRY